LLKDNHLDTQKFPDPYLIQLAEESTYAYQMVYARLPGGESGSDGKVTWYRSGLQGEFYNGVVRTCLDEEHLEESIFEVLRPFQQRNLPMRWYIGPSSQPGSLEQALQRCGLRFGWGGPALAMHLADLCTLTKKSADLEIEQVNDAQTLSEWIDLWVGKAPINVQQRLTWVYKVSNYGKDLDLRLYLGRIEKRAVATAAMFYGCPAVAIKHVSTLPEFQHRGIATALTLHTLEDAITLGRNYAALTSSPEGYPVYQRLGFQEVCKIRRFVWQAVSD
jgi:GNAT superfamily N-acetyltransferase